ncbi:hypothetical protein V1477_016235 [Vespula maculifrons]|uniref:Uncharacterized protein n=2 Tax=Vespula TaxID=7451 RepID=A0A834K2E9_VESVU|nr:hypothetical protein HZH66_006738 [Vespula vulgaris]
MAALNSEYMSIVVALYSSILREIPLTRGATAAEYVVGIQGQLAVGKKLACFPGSYRSLANLQKREESIAGKCGRLPCRGEEKEEDGRKDTGRTPFSPVERTIFATSPIGKALLPPKKGLLQIARNKDLIEAINGGGWTVEHGGVNEMKGEEKDCQRT